MDFRLSHRNTWGRRRRITATFKVEYLGHFASEKIKKNKSVSFASRSQNSKTKRKREREKERERERKKRNRNRIHWIQQSRFCTVPQQREVEIDHRLIDCNINAHWTPHSPTHSYALPATRHLAAVFGTLKFQFLFQKSNFRLSYPVNFWIYYRPYFYQHPCQISCL